MHNGDNARTDEDGTLLYQNGELRGVLKPSGRNGDGSPKFENGKDSAYLIRDMFDADGSFKTEFDLSDPAVKFIKEEFSALTDGGKVLSWGLLGRRLSSAYDSAQGGRALSTLLGCEDNYCSKWRKVMDGFFADNSIGKALSGKWEDSVCHFYIPKDENNVLHFKMPGNIVGTGAHIEGERTQVTYPNGTKEYLYKLTYGIKNPSGGAIKGKEDQTIKYNIYLFGTRTVKLFANDRKIKEGEEVRGIGNNEGAIPPKYSKTFYDRVCIKFRDEITTASGDTYSDICSPLSSYAGGPTDYGIAANPETGETGSAGDGAINDY